MPEFIFHVGMNKCGSSSLQAALSRHPRFSSPEGRSFTYLYINPRGRVLRADRQQAALRDQTYPFFPSSSFRSFDWGPENLEEARSIAEAAGGTCILSSESWLGQYQALEDSGLLSLGGSGSEVFIYLRPFVEWVNSAWWQWGAWGKAGFTRWFEGIVKSLPGSTLRFLEQWEASPHVRTLHLRVFPLDIVEDFFGGLGAPAPAIPRLNTSLPAELLRFMQSNRQYRPDSHSVDFDFVMARRLDRSLLSPTPWILPPSQVQEVLDATREVCLQIAHKLDPDSRRKMQADPRWWEPDAFYGRSVEPPDPVPLDDNAKQRLVAGLAETVLALDKALRVSSPASTDEPRP